MVEYEWNYKEDIDVLVIDRKDISEGDNLYQESVPFGSLIVDFDEEGNIAGLEILDASNVIGDGDMGTKQEFDIEVSLWKKVRTKLNRIKKRFY